MSFTHNCIINKDKKTEDIEALKNKRAGFEIVESFNNKSNYKDASINTIIVGTLTPYSGRENGYFYSANNQNQIQYRLIDKVFNKKGITTGLEKLKCKLIAADRKDKEKIIEDIKSSMNNVGVAFLDVIEKAESSISDPSDDAIDNFSLDYNSFSKEKVNYNKVILVPNSRNAEYALKKILKHHGIEPNSVKIRFASQCKRAKGGEKQRVLDLEKAIFGK